MSDYQQRLLKLIVMSDIHILPHSKIKRGLDTSARLSKAIQDANQRYMDSDLCVFAGDITDAGEQEAYTEFDRLRAALSLPQRVMMGNHDNRYTYLAHAKAPMQDEYGFVQGIDDIKGHRIIMLDSSQPDDHIRASGLCDKRLNWLADRLAEAKLAGYKVILILHHNPCALQMPVDTYRLEQPERLLRVLKASNAEILQIIAGHCHIPTAGSWGVSLRDY